MTTADTPAIRTRDAVAAELVWTPSVNAANTGVAVVDGAVTRSGAVVSYPESSLAEMAVLRVRGVAAIADEIAIRAWWDAPADTDTGTVDVKGAAWAIFQELRLQFDGVLLSESGPPVRGPASPRSGRFRQCRSVAQDGRPTRQGPLRAALISDMMTTDRESPVMDLQRTAIPPESATGPPSRAAAAARPNVTGCVGSGSAALRRPDGVRPSGDWVPRNQYAVLAAGPFHGTIADCYPTLASAPLFVAETVIVEHPTAPPDGLNRVRFPAPVPVAGLPRDTVSPHSAEQRPGGGAAVFGFVYEVPGSDRPARVGRFVVLSG